MSRLDGRAGTPRLRDATRAAPTPRARTPYGERQGAPRHAVSAPWSRRCIRHCGVNTRDSRATRYSPDATTLRPHLWDECGRRFPRTLSRALEARRRNARTRAVRPEPLRAVPTLRERATCDRAGGSTRAPLEIRRRRHRAPRALEFSAGLMAARR